MNLALIGAIASGVFFGEVFVELLAENTSAWTLEWYDAFFWSIPETPAGGEAGQLAGQAVGALPEDTYLDELCRLPTQTAQTSR